MVEARGSGRVVQDNRCGFGRWTLRQFEALFEEMEGAAPSANAAYWRDCLVFWLQEYEGLIAIGIWGK